ncbi:MAG: hypothetical protein ACLGGV_01055 [Bacteroidia bacterium]
MEDKRHTPNNKTPKVGEEKKSYKKILWLFWISILTPFALLALMLMVISTDDDLPSLTQLENPKSNLATTVPVSGTYKMSIIQAMRDKNLLDITDIGLKIVEAK